MNLYCQSYIIQPFITTVYVVIWNVRPLSPLLPAEGLEEGRLNKMLYGEDLLVLC